LCKRDRDACGVVECAPRYDSRILEAVRALDDRDEPMAETVRLVGRVAAELGLPKPSYVHLRRYIRELREEEAFRRARRREIAKILLDTYEDAMTSRRIDAYLVAERIREAGS
jgi:hypothetical protein